MIMEFSSEETIMLMADGYEPGFMMDIQEGDLVAIPPVTRTSFDGEIKPVKTLTVKRVVPQDASYADENDEIVAHTVINFIGITIDNLPEHCSYGCTYPCFIKRSK
jgi:hypothetical protein